MELTFGDLYEGMTRCTLAEVNRLAPTAGTILDLGAGSGRMVIPLASSGHRVVAVEHSGPMLEALRMRLSSLSPGHAERVDVRQASMSELEPVGIVDVVLCVFTVISYCLTEAELGRTFTVAAAALDNAGAFLLDVPDKDVFSSMDVESGDLIREVSMTEEAPGLFAYHEHTVLRTDEGPVEYRDSFHLRHWSVEDVTRILRKAGFTSIENVSERFPGLGAHYLVARTGEVSLTER
jgi:SAM-dependent methyltransferase